MKTDEFGPDPWIAVNIRDSGRESKAKPASSVTATVKKDQAEDDVALPTPIAATVPLGKIVTADGRELPYYHEIPGFVYQPLPGFEHCFKPRDLSQGTPSTRGAPDSSQTCTRSQESQPAESQQHAAYTERIHQSRQFQGTSARSLYSGSGRSAGSKPQRRRTLKRSRSGVRSIRQYTPTEYSSDEEDDDVDDDRDVKVATEQSFSFYIGDIGELKRFFRRRFDELTTRPLRTIVTAWIKQLEPRRLGGYGKYHKQLPSEQPPGCTPPWWPEDVPYNEPSHLSKGHLQILAVDVMLQHRKIDEVKRKGSWVTKLRQAAQCAIEMTTSELFSSSKRTEFSEKMKERALEFILPSLFDVAQSYEDHLAQYDLYEGTGHTDPGEGRHVTWHAASKPPRSVSQRKRVRRSRVPLSTRVEHHDEESADETEVDDAVSNSFLRRGQVTAGKNTRASEGPKSDDSKSEKTNDAGAPRQQVPVEPTPTATMFPLTQAFPKQEPHPDSSRPTPNTSFNQTMNDLQLNETMSMDMDVKGGDATQYQDPTLFRNMFPFSQPMQYSSSHPGYVFQPQGNASPFSNSTQSSFASGTTSGFASPFPMFHAPYSPQVGNPVFGATISSNNSNGFPYQYEGVFPATPMPHANASFDGLPGGFNVGGQVSISINKTSRNTLASNPTGAQNSTPYPQADYNQRLVHIRKERPAIREQFIRDRLMNPEGQMRLEDSVKIIGICTDMCPEFERVRRIVENDVKPPECTPETEHLTRAHRLPDESRMVKAYARPAAGMDVELVSDIRSPATCLKTVDYLMRRLDGDEFQFLQSWIWDRTRAVRKDLRTQAIEKRPDINILLTCLERTARFHLVSMHQMARSTKEDYSHQQDFEQLNQTLMSLRERYTDNRRANIPSENEAEFEAYRLILAPKFANSNLENDLHFMSNHLRHNSRVKTAIDINQLLKSILDKKSTNFIQCKANWRSLWDLIKSPKVSYLMACAAEVSFNRVRYVVLDSLWRVYRQGNSNKTVVVADWTTDKLKDLLGFDTDKEAVKLCEHFGFVFGRDDTTGQTFLDVSQMGFVQGILGTPSEELSPQSFSARLVESKRHDRAFSAIIQGLSVCEATLKRLIINKRVDTLTPEEEEAMNSLFVPEASSAGANPMGKAPVASALLTGTPLNPFSSPFEPAGNPGVATNTFPSSFQPAGNPGVAKNPFSSPFQPAGSPAVATNPFLKTTSQTQSNHAAAGLTATSIQPGVFDASKNSILFAPSGSGSSIPASNAPTNPFLAKQNTPQTPTPTNPFLMKETAPQPPQSNPFTKFAAPKPEQSVATTTPQPSSAFTFSTQKSNETSALSFTPSGPPPQENAVSQDAERQKTEQKQREAAERQQKEEEARRRAQEAQRARVAQEAEQRRKQAEAEAEQQRQRQMQLDRERQAREEQARRNLEAQQRQAQEEEARRARIRKRESALHSLTEDALLDPEEGLLMQYVEHDIGNMVKEALREEVWRKKRILANKMYDRRQTELKRAALAKIFAHVAKKKKAVQVRERRRRLKAERAQMAIMEEEDKEKQDEVEMSSAPTDLVATKTLSNGDSTFRRPDNQNNAGLTPQRPAAPANGRRARRTEERRKERLSHQGGASEKVPNSNDATRNAAKETATAPVKVTNGNVALAGYSEAHQRAMQRSTAPIDRTETDWFKLRAMGIDPSKHRKRSFDSSSEEEEEAKAEVKRAKLSPSRREPPKAELVKDKLPQIEPPKNDNRELPPATRMTTAEQQLARFRAIKQAFKKSATSPPQLPNGTMSVNGGSSFDGTSSNLIVKARELTIKSPMSEAPLINIQHDFGRSAPFLGLSASTTTRPTSGSSAGATNIDLPAYYHRSSRFVPRHLYGKGSEAVLAYRESYKKSPSNSVGPASTMQSSPVPTQYDYVPQHGYSQEEYTQQQFSERGSNDLEVINVDAEDENAILTDEEGHEEHEEEYEEEHVAYSGNVPSYMRRGMHYPVDQASEMADTEEDEEDVEEGYYKQGHSYAADEEVLEDYDEYSGEDEQDDEDDDMEEDEEEDGGPSQQHFAQPAAHGFARPTMMQPQQNKQPGATEEDAIELSD
ncbi:actin cytoskeleton and mitosis protein [Neocucurbitaria cava]|uniref:Actin cytoskeleton and mitosis protein n=1 Tax=Neocucurbitaria cava TaxID=798079 RepID=A0A9W8Y4H7_9PLEO|nr:actin cytoskeleton and mitosis protein [Neocucurbitaria cava]